MEITQRKGIILDDIEMELHKEGSYLRGMEFAQRSKDHISALFVMI